MTTSSSNQPTADLARLGMSASRVAQLIVDENWRVVVASAGAGRLLAREQDEIEGALLEDFVANVEVFAGCTDRECPEDGCFRQLDVKVGNSTLAAEAHCERFADADGNIYLNLVLHDASELEARDAMRAARLAKLNLLNQVSEALLG